MTESSSGNEKHLPSPPFHKEGLGDFKAIFHSMIILIPGNEFSRKRQNEIYKEYY